MTRITTFVARIVCNGFRHRPSNFRLRRQLTKYRRQAVVSTSARCVRGVKNDGPGICPKCGMALEPATLTLDEEDTHEQDDMSRRFRISAGFSVVLVFIAMQELIPGVSFEWLGSMKFQAWVQLLLAVPVVMWGGAPFFARAWRSVASGHLNMFTLIGLGTGVAFAYSVVATVTPGIFPLEFRNEHGGVGVYFEAAAVIVTLVLLGQVLELRARSRTGAAIKTLLGLSPATARG